MSAWWAVALLTAVAAAGGPAVAQSPKPDTSTSPATRRVRAPDITTDAGVRITGTGRHTDAASPMMRGGRQWGPLFLYQKDALRLSGELTAHKSPGRNKLDAAGKPYGSAGTPKVRLDALGKALAGEEDQLSALERTARSADRQALAQAHSHERQARTHYQALMHGGWDAQAFAQHAAAVHQELLLVDRSLHRGGGDPSTPGTVIHRAFGGQPRDTGGNVIRRAIH